MRWALRAGVVGAALLAVGAVFAVAHPEDEVAGPGGTASTRPSPIDSTGAAPGPVNGEAVEISIPSALEGLPREAQEDSDATGGPAGMRRRVGALSASEPPEAGRRPTNAARETERWLVVEEENAPPEELLRTCD